MSHCVVAYCFHDIVIYYSNLLFLDSDTYSRSKRGLTYFYLLDKIFNNREMFFIADRPKEIKQLTLCLWVYVDSETSNEATVVFFGNKLRVKISLGEDFEFLVSFYDWNRCVSV